MQDAVKLISPDSNVAVVVVVGERDTKSAVRAMTIRRDYAPQGCLTPMFSGFSGNF
jgi:hypothetical protein